jgi:fructose-1,6-bisphosphatase/inositol monophosphatase family enzyme
VTTWRSDIDAVTALITEAAQNLVLPRFRNLRPEDIEDKSTTRDRQDLVTAVDRDVEVWLARAFEGLEPGSAVIGEEAVFARPEVLTLLATDQPLWIIDPIDGTRNFARGDDGFGVMVARVVSGQTTASWLMLPARGDMFVAEAGAGTWLNGERVHVPVASANESLRGSMFVRYMPSELRTRVMAVATPQFEFPTDSSCAAVEYTDVVRGRRDFAVYYRLLPWDHAAPALILTEAGGCVEHQLGARYSVRSANQVTVVARSPDVSAAVRARLGGG